jgi:stage III sporulation protein AB
MLLILGGTAGFGFGAAMRVRQGVRQLESLLSALEVMQCELNYTKTPLPKLCAVVSKTAQGPISVLFQRLSDELQKNETKSVSEAMRCAISGTKRLFLPKDIVFCLLELGETLGKFDLEGQTALIKMTQQRIKNVLQTIQSDQKLRCRSYEALGLCAGAALIILIL